MNFEFLTYMPSTCKTESIFSDSQIFRNHQLIINAIGKQTTKGMSAIKKNFDIKRDYQRKMERLEARTEKAMALLIRKQVLEQQGQTATRTLPSYVGEI
jgi:hypothetical protein